ncbi:MAG TPA: nicotinate-nucleotide--dimethylbenzimidazole phosphoribosyltransferase [Pirellulales bacterium]|nr:nicotinate-nucleotide--dimethylbenzimidazole phosphoribosyltransferase [Pirellulales bacterium]
MRMTLITGGAASGKSRYALRRAQEWGPNILFVATCLPHDDEMRAKVARHRAERPPSWQTVEATRRVGDALRSGFDGAIIDCLTLLVSQMLVDAASDEEIDAEVNELCLAARNADYPVILVTNEVGFGVVPEHPLGRRFREVAGRANQLVASIADDVVLVVCGVPCNVVGWDQRACERRPTDSDVVYGGSALASSLVPPYGGAHSLTNERALAPPLDHKAMGAARRRLDMLTKPRGSLGRLEELGVQLAGITGRVPPVVAEKTIFLFAADHGVAAEGVSAYPATVTAQMVANFLSGGAAINVLARQAGASLVVADIGVATDIPSHPQLIAHKIGRGTGNMVREPAMTREQAERSIDAGRTVFRPCQLAGMGEMGIGNSTSAAAIVAAATGRPPAEVVGRGTGIDDATLARKIAAVGKALALHQPDGGDGISLLTSVGGFEIGALAGAMLAAAAARVPIVLDGFISTAAALVAVRLCPAVKGYLIAAHRSAEKGHTIALTELGLRPLLDLEMRLGEGTGAALAFHLIEAACRTMHEMATFTSAGVAERKAAE